MDTLIIDEEPLHILSRLHHHRRPAYAPRLCSRFRVKHHFDETGCFYPRIKHTQHYCVGIGKRVCEPLMILISQSCHSPLSMGFWIHKSTNSPVYTFSTLFYAKIMYFYMELLKAIDAILLPLKLLYFFPKKQGFFGNFYEILILKIVFFSIFAIFCWKNQ